MWLYLMSSQCDSIHVDEIVCNSHVFEAFLIFPLNISANMLVFQTCRTLRYSSRTALTASRSLRSHSDRSALRRLGAAAPIRAAGSGLLSSEDPGTFHHLLPAYRCTPRLGSCRRLATSPSVSSDAVGQIHSTHYHLVYTCKVAQTQPEQGWFSFPLKSIYLTRRPCRVARFAPPGPRRRSRSWRTTKVS